MFTRTLQYGHMPATKKYHQNMAPAPTLVICCKKEEILAIGASFGLELLKPQKAAGCKEQPIGIATGQAYPGLRSIVARHKSINPQFGMRSLTAESHQWRPVDQAGAMKANKRLRMGK